MSSEEHTHKQVTSAISSCIEAGCDAEFWEGVWYLPVAREPIHLRAKLPASPTMLVTGIDRIIEVSVRYHCIWFNDTGELQRTKVDRSLVSPSGPFIPIYEKG